MFNSISKSKGRLCGLVCFAVIATHGIPAIAHTQASVPSGRQSSGSCSIVGDSKLSSGSWTITPNELKWTKGFFGGSPHAAILGDETRPGFYVYRTLVPKGQRTPVHIHPDFRFVTVMSGNLLVGFTKKFDEKSMTLLPPGGAWIEPVRHAHYIWAKDGDVVVQVVGCGPTKMIPLDPAKPATKGL
jgi:hypothetical protein